MMCDSVSRPRVINKVALYGLIQSLITLYRLRTCVKLGIQAVRGLKNEEVIQMAHYIHAHLGVVFNVGLLDGYRFCFP